MLEPQVADPNGQLIEMGLKLVKGNFKISIDDFAAHTELIQVFKNENNCAVEVKYSFPLPDNAQFKGFEVYKDGKCYTAGLHSKDVASDNYDDHIASGGTAYMGQMSESIPNAFDLSIGNFLPGSVAVIKLSWLTPHDFEKDQQTRQINFPALNMRFSDSVTIQPISVKLSENIESITSSKDKIDVKIDGNTATIMVEQADNRTFRSINLTIKSAKAEPTYVVEESSETKEYPYAFKTSLSIPFTAAHRAELKKEREFVFILDCSGSMSGEKIEQACRALKLFLASLPTKSKFNVVRFGSEFFFLWPASNVLKVDTVQEAMKYADNSPANMSSTIVFDPLKAVLQAPAAKGSNGEVIPRVVFLLTDGQFSDRDKILELVAAHVHESSVYTIGLGDDVYEEDLKSIAQYGNGQALIVKSATSLQARIIEMLQSVMFGPPSVTLDFGVPVKLAVLDESFGSVKTYTDKIDLPLAPNRKYTLFGFMKEKPTRGLQMTLFNETTTLEMPKVVDGDGLHTIACGVCISQLRSEGRSSEVVDAITGLSLTFGVLSPYTAFVLTEIDNIGTPSYATMILEGLDIAVAPIQEKPVVENNTEVVPVEEKPKLSYTIEIPLYEHTSETQFNDELYQKLNVHNHEGEYKEVPPSILNSYPNLRTKIEMSEPLSYIEQQQLGDLFQEHITNKRAIQKMLRLRRNEEELLLEHNGKQEHADKIAEISGVMMKLAKDVEALYNQFNAIFSSYKPYDKSSALNYSDATLNSDLLVSKLMLTPKNEGLIKISNFDPKEFNSLKTEVDGKFCRARNMYKNEFPPTHPDALRLADHYGQYCRYVLKDIDKACRIGKEAFDNAISELDNLEEDSYKDSTLIMQMLRDQLTEMTDGENEGTGAETQSRRGAPKNNALKLVANKGDMDRILFMQHPDGNWNLNDVLNVIRIDRKKFEEFIGDKFKLFSESVWATVLVLAWLNEKFSEFISEFIMISVKAEQYLEDNNALDLIQHFDLNKLLLA
jgi:hypothetical protein